MKRSWNPWLWCGFIVALLGAVSYAFLLEYPVTRDVPWLNLLLFAIAAVLLGIGVRRAFTQPQRYRGKIFGVVLSVLALAVAGLFCYAVFGLLGNLPPSRGAPRAGARAPDFALKDVDGRTVTLSDLERGNRAVVLIFYRGYR